MPDHYWVGGGSSTNWNATVPTNWSLTDGGAGGATVPAVGDNVFFTGNSGTGASVWNTSISLNSLVCTGSKNLVTHNGAITLTISGGDLALPSGVGGTYTAASQTSLFLFSGTSGTQKITSSGKTMGALTLNGVGGTFQLQDNLNVSATANSSVITFTNGTFDCQTFTVATPQFSSNNANARTLTGSGQWTLTQTSSFAPWFATATMTVSGFSSVIVIAGASASNRTFTGGGLSYTGGLTVNANSLGGAVNISGANTFATLSVSAPNAILLAAGLTTTLTNAPTLSGSSGSEIFLGSNSLGTVATLSVATGTPTFTWFGIREITCSGGATFSATSSFDLGHNSGITITAPSGGGPVGQQCM